MPSSSLVEVEVGVLVKMQFSFLTFSVGRMVGVGWDGVVGEVRYRANLNSSCS